MRKIISILLALGMILALSIIGAPASADVTGPGALGAPSVAVTNPCEGQVGTYTINFTTTASLTQGVHSICIRFPAGTTIPPTGAAWEDGDIKIRWYAPAYPNTTDVFGKEVTVNGTEVCFRVPIHFDAGGLSVIFGDDAGIKHPPAGRYQLDVRTDRAPDNVWVRSALPGYTIRPCFSTYYFYWDASPTYPGIAAGFVPPYKFCGQNVTYDGGMAPREFAPGQFQNAFNLTFSVLRRGCFAPCATVDIYMQLTKSPQKAPALPLSTVTLNLSTPIPFDGVLRYDATKPLGVAPNLKVKIADDLPLTATTFVSWLGWIHFDTVGDYTLCVWAECPGTICTACGVAVPDPLARVCFDISVRQWKDAAKIRLDEKWNLISLPLVPFTTNITALLGSLDTFDYVTFAATGGIVAQFNLLSIWHYDAATGRWLVHGDGQTTLTTLEDGKAYWFRLRYPLTSPGLCGNYTWWVFGTERPTPPDGPKVYPVARGWNMVGFTSMNVVGADDYLSNWVSAVGPQPVIYGWKQGCQAAQGWELINFATGNLTPGQGYWMAFPSAGQVFQFIP